MKISKSFEAEAVDGTISMTVRPFLLLKVAILSAKLDLDGDTQLLGEKPFTITVNGKVVSSGTGIAGERMKFSPPIVLPRGRPTVSLSSSPYPPGYRAKGKVTLNIDI